MVLSFELQQRRVFFPREYRGSINEQGISLGLLPVIAACRHSPVAVQRLRLIDLRLVVDHDARRGTTTKAAQHVDRIALGEVAINGEAPILELLTSENHALLTGWHPILVLGLSLDVPNRVRRLDLNSNRPAHECADEDLYASWGRRQGSGGSLRGRFRPAARTP